MILERILAEKRKIIAAKKNASLLEKLQKNLAGSSRSLKKTLDKEDFGIIGEVKRGSPSAGIIDKNLNLEEKALSYFKAGVSGISVLTCEPFFYGSADDLKTVRKTVGLPLLMKDFIFDPYQIMEGRIYGADAVLLILKILSDDEFLKLANTAEQFELEVLVEVHSEEELDRAMRLVKNWDDKILGINNRNLENLKTDLNVALNLIKFVPQGKMTVIGESGIRCRSDIDALRKAGLKGALIGESILKSSDAERKIKELL